MEFYSDLLTLFWNKFIPECDALIRQGSESIVSKIVTFFSVIKNPSSKFSHRREGVKFVDEVKVKVDLVDDSIVKEEKETMFLDNTGVNVTPLTCSCHNLFQQEESSSVYNLFAVLLSSFPSPTVYTSLVSGLGQDKPISIRELLEQIILPKMEEESSFIAHPSVNIFMSLYCMMDAEEQKMTLKNIKVSFRVGLLSILARIIYL